MKDLVQIFLFTFVIVLTGCNASMDRYSGSGGLLHDHFDFRDYNDVVRRANIYCSSIGMGAPRISKISNGCLFCGSEYDTYNFTCEPNIYNQPSAYSPPPNVSYSKDISCNTDIECPSGLHCMFKPHSGINVCRTSGWKSTDTPQESTADHQSPVIEKPLNLEGFKTQCKELGFKVGTTDFGNCVLELNDSK